MTNQSQIHSVCLQMIAGGLLALKVNDATKVGTDKLNGAHLCVVCPNARYYKDGNILCAPAYLRDESLSRPRWWALWRQLPSWSRAGSFKEALLLTRLLLLRYCHCYFYCCYCCFRIRTHALCARVVTVRDRERHLPPALAPRLAPRPVGRRREACSPKLLEDKWHWSFQQDPERDFQ